MPGTHLRGNDNDAIRLVVVVRGKSSPRHTPKSTVWWWLCRFVEFSTVETPLPNESVLYNEMVQAFF